MYKLTYSRLLALICFIVSIGVFTSCNKNDNPVNDGKVQLLSFGPTGAKPGDTLKFIGINLDKVNSIVFTGTAATVDKKDFKSQNSDLILLIVPQGTEKGFVTLKTTDGDLQTKTQLNLKVAAVENTMTAKARPGENITINGNYLNWVSKVTFNSGKDVTTFVSKTLNQLVVAVPADAQTGPLKLTYLGTDSGVVATKDTLNVTLPITTALSPNPVKHANNLTITGTDLDLVTQVIFTGVAAPVTTYVSQSATQLVVKVPAGAQTGKITLVAASGVKTISTMDMNVMLPAISSFSPSPIDVGANLTITGTNLDLVSGISFVGVNSPVTTFVSQGPTQLVVKIPTGILKGKITLNVLNSTLVVQSATDLLINGGLPPLADFPYAIYTDATQNGFQDWSFTDVHDFNSTSNVRQGTKSIRAVYGGNGYQGVTFHAAGTVPSTAGYTKFEFSVYGETGTGGKKLNIVLNGNWGSPPQVTIVEGEWTTFTVTMSTLGNPTTFGEVVLQAAGWTGTLNIDHVGLR